MYFNKSIHELELHEIARLVAKRTNAKNIENFGWTFANDFVDTYSIIDHDQPQKCQLNINEFAVEKKINFKRKLFVWRRKV